MNSQQHVLVFNNLKIFLREIIFLIKSPVFILLTLIGNSIIGLFSYLFFQLESGINPKIQTFLDALWWGFSTATTTGYGDITPISSGGKILGMILMLVGLAFFGIFTALFAEAILTNT